MGANLHVLSAPRQGRISFSQAREDFILPGQGAAGGVKAALWCAFEDSWHLLEPLIRQEALSRNFPGGPVVKNLPSYSGVMSLVLGLVQLLSLLTLEPERHS